MLLIELLLSLTALGWALRGSCLRLCPFLWRPKPLSKLVSITMKLQSGQARLCFKGDCLLLVLSIVVNVKV